MVRAVSGGMGSDLQGVDEVLSNKIHVFANMISSKRRTWVGASIGSVAMQKQKGSESGWTISLHCSQPQAMPRQRALGCATRVQLCAETARRSTINAAAVKMRSRLVAKSCVRIAHNQKV
jgi:hypothetical protein